jgi:hypothetical protein
MYKPWIKREPYMIKENRNVKFIDYHFDVTPDGIIIMDKELTLEHIKSCVGDLYIVMLEMQSMMIVYLTLFTVIKISPGGGIGRHKGLKIPRRKLRDGSSPSPGTN